ncbi:MAG: hypothetical protein OCD02_04865 [Spirochaetaceae bacterium]
MNLVEKIKSDNRLDDVLNRSKKILSTGFNAGDGYGEVWIRDLATFIELSCEVYAKEEIRQSLLLFFIFQREDGNIIDGYTPKEMANIDYEYIHVPGTTEYVGHKNTVETDQESSLIHSVCLYIEKTGDRSILTEIVNGETVSRRIEMAMEYLMADRYAEKYGLLWGGTTADWGDVQPEHEWGVVLDESSHRAISIYNNALFIVALNGYLDIIKPDEKSRKKWEAILKKLKNNVHEFLWDKKRRKFIPHIYLEGSPFPEDLDEDEIYYHGGTAVAIQAGLLSQNEIIFANRRMVENVIKSGAGSIGLTIYPPYPENSFKNPMMAKQYSYQNGGDWTWFGGRMIQELIRNGFIGEAYTELIPMVDRVIKNDGFYEWYTVDNKAMGSGTFRGSAGVLGKAIQMLQEWVDKNSNKKEV